jgi:hypothetical protein
MTTERLSLLAARAYLINYPLPLPYQLLGLLPAWFWRLYLAIRCRVSLAFAMSLATVIAADEELCQDKAAKRLKHFQPSPN